MSAPVRHRPYLIHPSSLMMVLVMFGITALFGAVSAAYVYARVDQHMITASVPWLFLINTGILLMSSLFIEQCRSHFDGRHEALTLRYGYLAAAASILFLVMQGVAWHDLFTSGKLPATSGGYGYLYALSILHFLHVIAGIPFLLRLLWPMTLARHQGNAALLLIDDHLRRKLKHTAWYWHFIDVVWVYLMLFLFFNQLW